MSRRTTDRGGRTGRRTLRRYLRLAFFLASLIPLAVAGRHFMGCLSGGDILRLASVEVSGAVEVSPEEVGPLARLEMGTPLLSIDPASLSREITAHPWIRCARVGRELPDRLHVQWEEREPLALLLTDRGLIPVDAEGTLLPDHPGVVLGDLPFITGVELPDSIRWGEMGVGTPWGTAVLFLHELAVMGVRDEGTLLQVAELHLDSMEGEITVVTEGGGLIRFTTDRLSERLGELFLVLEELSRRDLRAGTIDLRFDQQVVVRGILSTREERESVLEGGEAG